MKGFLSGDLRVFFKLYLYKSVYRPWKKLWW